MKSDLASVTTNSGLLVTAQISKKHKFFLAYFANERPYIIVNMNMVHQVANLLELSLAPVVLANQSLLLAV